MGNRNTYNTPNGFGALDEIDGKILSILKEDARATYSKIGEQVGLSRVAVKNRIEAMEDRGVIQGYYTKIKETKASPGIGGVEDLMRIRNCGRKSAEEILEKLFCFQYGQVDGQRKIKYIYRVLEMNQDR